MIRWTKDGKVDRAATLGVICSGQLAADHAEKLSDIQDDLADALDVAVAALRKINSDWDSDGVAKEALRAIGADHASD